MAEAPDFVERHALLRAINDRLVNEMGFTFAETRGSKLDYHKLLESGGYNDSATVHLADNDLPAKDSLITLVSRANGVSVNQRRAQDFVTPEQLTKAREALTDTDNPAPHPPKEVVKNPVRRVRRPRNKLRILTND